VVGFGWTATVGGKDGQQQRVGIMSDKVIDLDQFTALLEDGMTIGIGGWAVRRKPMALVRAICRSPVSDLTVVSYGGPDVGLLCAAGKIRRLIFGFVSLDDIPLDPHFRIARELGRIEATEYDEGMLQWGLYAAGLRLPFLPTRAGMGSDIERLNPHLRRIASPYDGEEVLAMPPIPLDLALVHVNRADRRGNGQILGPDPYFDDLFCGAARIRVVSAERIVETDEMLAEGGIRTMALNRMMTDHVIEVPGGAHPTSCEPDYPVDPVALSEYAASADSFDEYRERLVDISHTEYLQAAGLADNRS